MGRQGQPNLGALKLMIFFFQTLDPGKRRISLFLNSTATATALSIRLPMTAFKADTNIDDVAEADQL
jgi:hypothetical protein